VSFLALVLCRCQEQAVLRFCVFTSASFDVGKNSIDIATFRNPNQGPNAPRKSYDLEFYINLWLQARGLKKHLKRLNAPSHWMLDKLGGAFVSSFRFIPSIP
jgi:hypothetical protein